MDNIEIEKMQEWVRGFVEKNPDSSFNVVYQASAFDKNKDVKAIMRKAYRQITRPMLDYNSKNKKLPELTYALSNLKRIGLQFDEKYNIVLLNSQNVSLIENIIEKDDDYYPFSHQIFKSFDKEQLKKDKVLLTALIREIDRDNNTNVWRYNHKDSIRNTASYIADPKNDFFKKLEEGNHCLPDLLPESNGTMKSLSSKICKYLADYFFPGKELYFINDKYVRAVLPFYLDYYKVENGKKLILDAVNCKRNGRKLKNITSSCIKNLSYEKLFDVLDMLKKAAELKHGFEIGRSKLDHILWYCYKSYEAKY